MIIITKAAQDQIREQVAQNEQEGLVLRVAATPDTKGGINYGMGFDESHDDDTVIAFTGFDVAISPNSEDLLEGCTLDFVEMEPGDFRYIFINPNDPQQEAPTRD